METSETSSRRQFLERAALVTTGIAVAGTGVEPAWATPPTGKLTRTELAKGRLAENITVSTSGPTDFHIHQVVIDPGADSGWHTHPGIALDIVKSGTVTAYFQGADCKPVTFQAGQAIFVPARVPHMARNEGSVPAEVYVTYLVDAGATVRGEAEKPANCPS
jgi:mannose-6-phosphate isomerase-like protein (cupin superfamily)